MTVSHTVLVLDGPDCTEYFVRCSSVGIYLRIFLTRSLGLLLLGEQPEVKGPPHHEYQGHCYHRDASQVR